MQSHKGTHSLQKESSQRQHILSMRISCPHLQHAANTFSISAIGLGAAILRLALWSVGIIDCDGDGVNLESGHEDDVGVGEHGRP